MDGGGDLAAHLQEILSVLRAESTLTFAAASEASQGLAAGEQRHTADGLNTSLENFGCYFCAEAIEVFFTEARNRAGGNGLRGNRLLQWNVAAFRDRRLRIGERVHGIHAQRAAVGFQQTERGVVIVRDAAQIGKNDRRQSLEVETRTQFLADGDQTLCTFLLFVKGTPDVPVLQSERNHLCHARQELGWLKIHGLFSFLPMPSAP